ncbi:hypothetical protein RND81_10G104800 [Saponaria officinalis]|uniref:Uncharacterized protein n=1 Tax=Saponaria officinalis TaxID=3572 RepID=A0AAW1I359_SAPOF
MIPITTMVYMFITSVIFLANPSDFEIPNQQHHRPVVNDYGFGYVHPGASTLHLF